MEIVEEPTGEIAGHLLKPLIEPDKGLVLGFFVAPGNRFLSRMDIIHFGARLAIRDADALCDPRDIIRLQPILDDNRPVLGQRIRTETGDSPGTCADIQFDTDSMKLTWLFPKKWWRWRRAIPVTQVLEVRRDFILVKNPDGPVLDDSSTPVLVSPVVKPGI